MVTIGGVESSCFVVMVLLEINLKRVKLPQIFTIRHMNQEAKAAIPYMNLLRDVKVSLRCQTFVYRSATTSVNYLKGGWLVLCAVYGWW